MEKKLGEMMLVENIEPLQGGLLTKHIKNKTLQFKTLYRQECGREAGDGWTPTILSSEGHLSGR